MPISIKLKKYKYDNQNYYKQDGNILTFVISFFITCKLLPPAYPAPTMRAIVKSEEEASVMRNFKGCILIIPDTINI